MLEKEKDDILKENYLVRKRRAFRDERRAADRERRAAGPDTRAEGRAHEGAHRRDALRDEK